MIEPVDNNLSGKSGEFAEELPGQLLKEARESKKMSQEEVAERLHLDIDVIRALESDNYANLPGKTYIRGYVRSYAALLGIPFAKISFFMSGSANESGLLPENVNYANVSKEKKFSYLWISAVLLFFLIIISGLFQLDDEINEQKENIVSNEAELTAGIQRESEAAQEKTEDTKSGAEVKNAEKKSQDKVVAQKEDKAEKRAGLELIFKQTSWTEVYDLNGKKLVYGMIKQGEKIEVEGLQPYSVLLGNAEGVDVMFEGKPFSHTKYIRNGMAQFVIGSSIYNK